MSRSFEVFLKKFLAGLSGLATAGLVGENCWKTWIYKECELLWSVQKIGIGRKRGAKTMYLCQFSIEPHRKRKTLTVQGVYKIIDVGRNDLCFLII